VVDHRARAEFFRHAADVDGEGRGHWKSAWPYQLGNHLWT
jgi:hypothetical protein